MSADAVEAVRSRAIGLLGPTNRYGIATDVHTYSRTTKKPPAVLIGIATRRAGKVESLVMAMDASEYDATAPDGGAAMMILDFMGLEPPTAMETAQVAKAALKK